MLFSFARVDAGLSLKRQDFYYRGCGRWVFAVGERQGA